MLADSHCHVNFEEYESDREEVIKRAQKAGVKMLCVGINAGTAASAIKLADKYPEDIWATVGYHPNENLEKFDIQKLRNLAGQPKAVAIGECGLDYYRIRNQESAIRERQREIFLEQIHLAKELSKPLMIHCRPSKGSDDAYDDLFNLLTSEINRISDRSRRPIIHFFTGSLTAARGFLEMGCYFTFGGVITFSRDYDEVIKFLPLESILLETDAPYVAPVPHRGERNEPAYVIEIAKKLAEIKQISFEKAAQEAYHNFYDVFLSSSSN